MDKEEFIKLATSCGYSTKSAAKKYTELCQKESYSNDDFIALHEGNMRWSNIKTDRGMVYIKNGKTTAFSNGIKGNSDSGQDWKY